MPCGVYAAAKCIQGWKKMAPTGKNLPEINNFLAIGKITG
jgi:hypothetical protein